MHKLKIIGALMLASFAMSCSNDTNSETQTASIEKAERIHIENAGTRSAGIYSFDLHQRHATATLLGLGYDVRVNFDGSFEFHEAQVINRPRSKWSYRVDVPIVKRGDRITQFSPVTEVYLQDHELSLRGRDHVVRFEHKPNGLKHTVDVFQRPAGNGPLELVLGGSGATLIPSGDRVEVHRDGSYNFAWSGLVVTDASGQELTATMSADHSDLLIRIDDANAIYPITVDPLANSPRWTQESSDATSRFGFSAAGAGDVNNDGVPDLVVGQPRYDSSTDASEFREGRALVYYGQAGSNPMSTAAWTYEGNVSLSDVGNQVRGVGDVNGDGVDDMAVAAFLFNAPGGLNFAGAVFVFHGSATGPASTPDTILYGEVGNQRFGGRLANIGDVNCDGFDDIGVGSIFFNSSSGKAWVFEGGSTGVNSTPIWSFEGINGENLSAGLIGGNFNGDTNMVGGQPVDCADLAVGSPAYDAAQMNVGRIRIFNGGTTGLPLTADLTIDGPTAGNTLGGSLAAGNLNGDGFDDLVAGSSGADTGGGIVDDGGYRAFYGTGTGLPSTSDYFTRAGALWNGAGSGSASAAGDINNDGFDDVLIGAFRASSPEIEEGGVWVELGSSTGMNGTRALEETSDNIGAQNGTSIQYLGDIDQDGVGDFVSGAPRWKDIGGTEVGAVIIHFGAESCDIGAAVYADGEENPANPCEICDTATSRTSFTAKANGTTCDDGDLCTTVDTCQAGICSGGSPVQCNDGNQCTIDLCNPTTGLCSFDAAAADGNTCTLANQPSCQTNVCSAGSCNPTTISGCLIGGTCFNNGDTNPANPCEVCDPTNSQTDWTNAPATTSCEDGLFCTVGDTCDGAGTCVGGGPRDCSGAAEECYDSVTCSEVGDTCLASNPTAAGTACGGDLCTTGGTCDGAGNCSGNSVDCSNLDTECMVGQCNLADGSCSAIPRQDGTPCDDGDACTAGTTCQGGSCGMGMGVMCDDMNPCTDDSCDSSTGCVFDAAPNEGDACSDGDACTENDACTSGTCTGTALMCDDGNSCTADSCDPAGGCQFDDEPDGTMCVGDALSCTTDTCNAGTCESTLDAGSCVIDDTCFAAGVENPDNTCQVCDPAQATDAFSPKMEGESCGLGQCSADGNSVVTGTCTMGACTPAGADMDRDCAPYVCNSGACLDSCVEDADCQDGFVCDDNNACTEPVVECERDDDCDDGEVCLNDLCVTDTCTNDDDCPGDLVCGEDGACTDPDTDDCMTDEDCATGEICNAQNECEDGTVDPGTCTDDSDCGADSRCENAVCVKGAVEGGGCGCAASDAGPTRDASWILLAAMGLIGWLRRRR